MSKTTINHDISIEEKLKEITDAKWEFIICFRVDEINKNGYYTLGLYDPALFSSGTKLSPSWRYISLSDVVYSAYEYFLENKLIVL